MKLNKLLLPVLLNRIQTKETTVLHARNEEEYVGRRGLRSAETDYIRYKAVYMHAWWVENIVKVSLLWAFVLCC